MPREMNFSYLTNRTGMGVFQLNSDTILSFSEVNFPLLDVSNSVVSEESKTQLVDYDICVHYISV